MASNRTFTLKSSNGETFEVDELVALEFQVIKNVIKDGCADNGIPLLKVTSKILSKVIEYCKKHVEASNSEDRTATGVNDDLNAWDAKFVKVDRSTLRELMRAADYLDIKSLLDLTCQAYADCIKKTILEEMWKKFNTNIIPAPEKEEEEFIRRFRNNLFFEVLAYDIENHPIFQDRLFFEDVAHIFPEQVGFLFQDRLFSQDHHFFEELAHSFQELLFCQCPHFFKGPNGFLTWRALPDWIKNSSLGEMWKKFNNIIPPLEDEEEVRRFRSNIFFEEVAYHFRNHPFFQERRFFQDRRFFIGRCLFEHVALKFPLQEGFLFRDRLFFQDNLFFEEVARSFYDLLFCRCPHFFEGPDGFLEYHIFLNPSSKAAVRRVLDDLYSAEEEARRICF